MCKMLYRLRMIVTYTWDTGVHSADEIKSLYNDDETFAKMQEIILACLFNLFTGTNPNQKLRDDESGISIIKKFTSPEKQQPEETKKRRESKYLSI